MLADQAARHCSPLRRIRIWLPSHPSGVVVMLCHLAHHHLVASWIGWFACFLVVVDSVAASISELYEKR